MGRTKQKMPPGLYRGTFSEIDPYRYDEIWIAVRQLKSVPANPIGNVRYVRILSPSKRLWYHYLDLRRAGNWNETSFMGDYAPKLLKEMLLPGPLGKLRELKELTRTKSVLVVCYCKNRDLCHTRLLGKIIETMP